MEYMREAPIGQLVRFLTKNKYFKYPEEQPGFKLPDPWLELMNNPDAPGHESPASNAPSSQTSTVNVNSGSEREKQQQQQQPRKTDEGEEEEEEGTTSGDQEKAVDDGPARGGQAPPADSRLEADEEQAEVTRVESTPIVPRKTKTGAILVDWYYTDDAADPHNWTNRRRLAVGALICSYTFIVYTSSAIYTASTQDVMRVFGVSGVEASLGLSLYVLGYGIGPLVFSPLSEIPRIGRNPVYIATMFLFVILSIPTAFVGNFAGLLVLRFLQGFFGSPCLASGGASLGDMYSLMSLPYALTAWVAAAYCGPALGPLLSGFAVPAESWRWSLYEIIWGSAPVFIAMFLFLPETSSPNILLRRAQRLRKLTGDNRFMSQSEIDQRNMKFSHVALDALIKPMEITLKDPAVLFVQIYTAIIYGIYYSCKSPACPTALQAKMLTGP